MKKQNGQRALAVYLAMSHHMKGLVSADYNHWIHSKKNRDFIGKAVNKINRDLFVRRKNQPMEFQDFQWFTTSRLFAVVGEGVPKISKLLLRKKIPPR